MDVTTADIEKLAIKLIETFSWHTPRLRGFDRYWPLAGPVQTYSEQAANQLEQDLSKALLAALEAVLRRTAPQSCHMEAESVARFLDAKPEPPRRYTPRRQFRRRGSSF